ncbi:Tex-like N-terminal domain-containing protein [Escherichia coli]
MPFIARYRKEITGGLDDTQLRNLETRLSYLRELEERRQAILNPFPSKANSPMIWRRPSTPP